MRKGYKNKRIVFVGSFAAIMIACVFFIITSFQDEIVFFYSPSDLLLEKNIKKTQNQKIRVGGLVRKGSVQRLDALKIRFAVEDGKEEIVIEYSGLTPDLFREGQGIIAAGKYDNKIKIFQADKLLVKHDEKYMPPEVAKAIKSEYKK